MIRTFRPDVIVTRFSPEPGPTHGHHTASVVLAVEAFKLAGDPQAFPEQLGELTPWQPTRIFHNVGLGGAGAGAAGEQRGGRLKLEIGGNDPVSGESFAAIAARSRGMHKTQGFGVDTPAAPAAHRRPSASACSAASPPRRISSTEWTRRGTACRAAPRSDA